MLDPEAAGRSPKIKTHLSRKGIATSAHQAAQPQEKHGSKVCELLMEDLCKHSGKTCATAREC
jgi:hypothetical protein